MRLGEEMEGLNYNQHLIFSLVAGCRPRLVSVNNIDGRTSSREPSQQVRTSEQYCTQPYQIGASNNDTRGSKTSIIKNSQAVNRNGN